MDDAWDKIGRIVPLTVGAYLVAYFVLSLIFAASLNATNGLFIVVLAVLLIVASVARSPVVQGGAGRDACRLGVRRFGGGGHRRDALTTQDE